MPSSYTALGFELQAAGENLNTWGDAHLNNTIKRINYAIAGQVTIALTGDVTLTSDNTSTTQADFQGRNGILKFTGAGPFTVTVPSTAMRWYVWNACTGVVTLTTGSGTTVAVQSGEMLAVFCDATNVMRAQGTYFASQQLTGIADPTTAQMAATKAYVDNTAFTMAAGALPGQSGNAGNVLITDGTTATWSAMSAVPSYITDQASKTTTATGLAIAFAAAL